MEKIYNDLQYKIQEIQEEMKAFVNYVFKDKVNKLKHGVLTEDEVYEWLLNNK